MEQENEWNEERTRLLERQQHLTAFYEQNVGKLREKICSERENLELVKYQVKFLNTTLMAKTGDLRKVIEQKTSENTEALNTISLLKDSLEAEKLPSKDLKIFLARKQEETETIRAELHSKSAKAEQETLILSETVANLTDELQTKEEQHQE